MSEAADARESGLDPRDRIKVIGRFRPLEPGAEAAPWIVNGSTLTYATGLEPLAVLTSRPQRQGFEQTTV